MEMRYFYHMLMAYIDDLVNIKWGKERFDNVQVNTDEPPLVFKAQIFALSGVEPARQKVMFKGKVLKVISTCFRTIYMI